MAPVVSKLAKNKFRCFKCRLVFGQKDGDWVNWGTMQVHLCKGCDKSTAEDGARSAEPFFR